MIRAPRVKPLPLRNADFRFREAPWSHLVAEPFRSGPPWSHLGADNFLSGPPWTPPRPSLEPPRPPKILPGTPRSAQGPHQIHKVNMLKTLEIHTFALPGSQKNALGRFFDPPRPPQRPSRVSPLIVRVAPGDPKGRLGAPREPPRTPKDGPKRSQDPLRMPLRPPLERFHEIHVKKDPSRPPRCPPRCPWRSPSASNILSEDVFHRFFQELLCFCLFVC